MGDIDVIVPVTFLHFSQTEGAEGGRRRRLSYSLLTRYMKLHYCLLLVHYFCIYVALLMLLFLYIYVCDS